jgi:hypothetical protein
MLSLLLVFNPSATLGIMKTLLCLLALAAALTVKAQTTIALQSYSVTDAGYDDGTAGWSFRPLTNISVTALGCSDEIVSSELGPTWVGLWAADGTLLASNAVTTNSALTGLVRYQSIDPVLLSSNETYYLGAFSTNGMVINAYDPEHGNGYDGPVNMAPEIQLESAIGSTDESFSFPGNIFGPPGSAILAPNFQFQDGIASPILDITLTSNNVVISWSVTYTNLALQENSDLSGTNWTDVTNSVNVVGGENQVLVSASVGNDFYRLKS